MITDFLSAPSEPRYVSKERLADAEDACVTGLLDSSGDISVIAIRYDSCLF